MKPSMHFLTKQLFDYAGLFPPAQLSLNAALKNYLSYQIHEYKNILGKFVLPVSKSDEFLTLCRVAAESWLERQSNQPGPGLTEVQNIPCSILLSQAKNDSEILECLAQDLVKLDSLQNEYKKCKILSFEICFPDAC